MASGDAAGANPRGVGAAESAPSLPRGLSRSVSNLGSSLGTAIAGTILVSDLAGGNHVYVIAMAVLGGFGLLGLGAAMLLPAGAGQALD